MKSMGQCEGRVRAQGVTPRTPRFGWVLPRSKKIREQEKARDCTGYRRPYGHGLFFIKDLLVARFQDPRCISDYGKLVMKKQTMSVRATVRGPSDGVAFSSPSGTHINGRSQSFRYINLTTFGNTDMS